MDTNQPPVYPKSSTPPPPPRPLYNVFGTKIPSGVAFAVGILLFLLPFAEVKCNGKPFAKNSGLGIAIGKEWKEEGSLFGEDVHGNTQSSVNQKNDPNAYAIVALALGVLGLVLSLMNARAAIGGALISGVLSSASLIGLMLDLNRQVKDPNPVKGEMGNQMDRMLNDVKVTIDFTPWFYIAVVSFIAAAFFCYKRMQATRR